MVATSRRMRFTVDEYHQMGEAGILKPGQRSELLVGEILMMTPVGSEHLGCVNWLNRELNRLVGERGLVSVQNPLRLSDESEPEPDIALLKAREDDYRSAHPTAADVLLLIEVSDTSLEHDRTVKLPLYAAAGIGEVWIIDLPSQGVEVHRRPGKGRYDAMQRHAPDDRIVPSAFPDVDLSVAAILGA